MKTKSQNLLLYRLNDVQPFSLHTLWIHHQMNHPISCRCTRNEILSDISACSANITYMMFFNICKMCTSCAHHIMHTLLKGNSQAKLVHSYLICCAILISMLHPFSMHIETPYQATNTMRMQRTYMRCTTQPPHSTGEGSSS